MKTNLRLAQNQKLSITPQLKQAIRLLQLSRFELQEEMALQIAQNPLLEWDNDPIDNLTLSSDKPTTNQESREETLISEYSHLSPEEKPIHEPALEAEAYLEYNQRRTLDEGGYSTTTEPLAFSFESKTLHQELLLQLTLSSLKWEDQAIAIHLIDDLDENGYLQSTLSEIETQTKLAGLITNESHIEQVLFLLQQFEPLGIGARNLTECLMIQLNALPKTTPCLQQAKTLVLHYLEVLAKRDFQGLKRRMDLSGSDLNRIIELITQLDPKPGLRINDKKPGFIIPDLIVFRKQNCWTTELNLSNLPRIKVNMDYAKLIHERENKHSMHSMRRCLNEAHWFVRSIQQRHKNLLKVSQCITQHQQAFFTQGEEALLPLKLADIAKEVGLHESTVSRLTHGKYLQCSRGIFELKLFLTHAIPALASTGRNASAALRATVKRLIDEECGTSPLSDQQIVEMLAKRQIYLSRRTVSKYRLMLKIPPSHERKYWAHKENKKNHAGKSPILGNETIL